MSVSLAGIQNDLAYVDGAETIVFRSAASNISVTVENAVRESVTRDEAEALGGLFDGSVLAWTWNKAPLDAQGLDPAEGDDIVPLDGTTWLLTKLGRKLDALGIAYRAVTVKAR